MASPNRPGKENQIATSKTHSLSSPPCFTKVPFYPLGLNRHALNRQPQFLPTLQGLKPMDVNTSFDEEVPEEEGRSATDD